MQSYECHQELAHQAPGPLRVFTDLRSKIMLGVNTGLRLLNILNQEKSYMWKCFENFIGLHKRKVVLLFIIIIIILKRLQITKAKKEKKQDPNRWDLITQNY